jgi:hypothetical protein
MSVRVREESALEHFVIGGLNAWDEVSRSEGTLLGLKEIVHGVLVQGDLSDWDQRVVTMRDNLGDIKDIVLVLLAILLRNELDIPSPRGEIALSNVFIKILESIILVSARELTRLLGSEVLDSLVGLEVVLNVVDLTLVIDPFVGVRTISVHVSESIRGASVREENGNLVERLGCEGPEVPSRVRVLISSGGISLLRVDEVGELDRVIDEKDGGVVSNHIVVTLLGVELNSEATGISISISRSELSSNS